MNIVAAKEERKAINERKIKTGENTKKWVLKRVKTEKSEKEKIEMLIRGKFTRGKKVRLADATWAPETKWEKSRMKSLRREEGKRKRKDKKLKQRENDSGWALQVNKNEEEKERKGFVSTKN